MDVRGAFWVYDTTTLSRRSCVPETFFSGSTTQKVDRHGNRYGYISSFVGFAPVEAPRIVIAVVVDEPQGAYYGSAVAAPVFGSILRRGWVHLGE